MAFFEKHKLHLRVYYKFYKLVHRYESSVRNTNNKVTHCLMTDGHIYTLNHDTKRLDQMEDKSDSYTPQVGDTYYIKDDAKPRASRMISNVDDLLRVLATYPNQRTQQKNKY